MIITMPYILGSNNNILDNNYVAIILLVESYILETRITLK